MSDDQLDDIKKAIDERVKKAEAAYEQAVKELEAADKKLAARQRELDLANERLKNAKTI